MLPRIIEQYIEQTQPATIIEFGSNGVFFIGEEVYCPMCECLHENNTMCQMGGF